MNDFETLSPRAWALPNGVQLHTVREGRGTPLIFIHGAMGDWRSWDPQWPAFTARFGLAAGGLVGAAWPLKANVFVLGVATGAFRFGARLGAKAETSLGPALPSPTRR